MGRRTVSKGRGASPRLGSFLEGSRRKRQAPAGASPVQKRTKQQDPTTSSRAVSEASLGFEN
eukprot:11222159-Lingulodinium_polyedra.AAC.1